MRTFCFSMLLLVSTSLGFGQQSLTVTASRSISLQPDQVVFGLSVTSGLNTGLDEVLAALGGAAISAADLIIVSSSNSQVMQWTFRLNVPLSKMKDTSALLMGLQQTIAQNKSGLTLTFNVQGTQVSPQLQVSDQCPIADLVADARAQAQKIVNTTGGTIGPILALLDSTGVAAVPFPSIIQAAAIPVSRLYIPVQGPPTPPLNCNIVVKFSVLP